MRAASLILLCALITSACNREPSFDDRYNEQSEKIGATANTMALELGNQLNASVAAGRLDASADTSITLSSPTNAQ